MSQSQTSGLIFQLVVKVGARVMLTYNVDQNDELVNGQIGVIVHIKMQSNEPKTIYVKFDNESVGRTKISQDPLARQYNAVPIERHTAEIKTHSKKAAAPIIKRTQFPLGLSWACTVHKVQGLSLSQVLISFDLLKQKSFNHGQMYVALSRVTSLEGLFIIGNLNKGAITADPRTLREYEYLRENQSLPDLEVFSDGFKITLSNVRSLSKHIADINADTRFTKSDLILCTETQLTDNSQTSNISINAFSATYNNSEHKFSSLAHFSRENINTVVEFQIDGFSILHVTSEIVDLRILLVYRKHDSTPNSFNEVLQYLITAHEIDIVTGDFNMKPTLQLDTVQSYDQCVLEPTHLGGSILDHVYVKRSVRNHYNIKVSLCHVFFSDHEAINIVLKRNSFGV